MFRSSPPETRILKPSFYRPAWVEISLSALRENFRRLRRRLKPETKLLFVVKADAYGHGLPRLVREAQHRRLCDWLGVSSVEEGILARRAGARMPILILGSLYPFESFRAALAHDLTPTLSSLEAAKALSRAAAAAGRRAGCHLKIDTGMGRIGVAPRSAKEIVRAVSEPPLSRSLRVTGLYTHFASAEEAAFTGLQIRRFKAAFRSIAPLLKPAERGRFLLHAANSQALLRDPSSQLGMVRSGLALYGLHPDFVPALSLKSRIVYLKSVPAGAPISYGRTFTTRRPSRIATVPLGYGDGVRRGLSNRGWALVGGRRARIVGQITMDMLMLDVTSIPDARVGDEAVFIGSQGSERLEAWDAAALLGCTPYEIVCPLKERLPRVYRP